MKIAENIEVLDINSNLANGPGITHPALLTDRDDLILIDGGLPSQFPDIQNAALMSGINFDKLNHIIITHSDMDHIGCLSAITRNLDHKIEVIAHENEKPYIECELPPIRLSALEARLDNLKGAQYEQMKALRDSLRANYRNLRVEVGTAVSGGESLPYCGGIRIIHTPGHTPSHICLYLPKHKILFAGDALNVEAGNLERSPVFTTTDPAAYADSIKKLTQYDIESVVCFHGGVFKSDANRRIAEIAGELL